jgi:hypothetical protein
VPGVHRAPPVFRRALESTSTHRSS